jgi:hypothetical protein
LNVYIHGKKQQNTVRLQPPTRDEVNSQTWPWKQYHQTWLLQSERQKLVLFTCLLPACCTLVLRRGILEAEEEEEEEEDTERLTCKQGSNAWGHGNPVARRSVCSCHKAIATPRTVAPPPPAAIRPEFLYLLHLLLLSFFQLPYHTSTINLQLLRLLRSLSLSLSLARSLLVVAAVIKTERASGPTERAYLVLRGAGGRTWSLASQSTGKRKRGNKRARTDKHTTDDRCLSGNVFFVRNRIDRPSAMMLLLCIAPLDRGARSTACAKSVL